MLEMLWQNLCILLYSRGLLQDSTRSSVKSPQGGKTLTSFIRLCRDMNIFLKNHYEERLLYDLVFPSHRSSVRPPELTWENNAYS